MLNSLQVNPNEPYTDDYKNKCFALWYMYGKPSKIGEMIDKIPQDEYGRIPNKEALSRWRNQDGWDWRADTLDLKVQEGMENALVENKILMLKEQAAKGRELQILGMEHIRETGFDSSSAAVAAVIKGAEMEKSSRGLSEAITKIANMTEEQLKNSIMDKLTRESENDTIDAQFTVDKKENKETKTDSTDMNT